MGTDLTTNEGHLIICRSPSAADVREAAEPSISHAETSREPADTNMGRMDATNAAMSHEPATARESRRRACREAEMLVTLWPGDR